MKSRAWLRMVLTVSFITGILSAIGGVLAATHRW